MKVISEISLRDFKFWSGGEDRAKNCTDEQLDKIESIMESDAPESGWTDDDINNFFWFDFDTIADCLGYKDGNYPAESQVPVYTSSDVTASYAIKLRLKGELTLTGDEWMIDYIYAQLAGLFQPYPPTSFPEVFMCKGGEQSYATFDSFRRTWTFDITYDRSNLSFSQLYFNLFVNLAGQKREDRVRLRIDKESYFEIYKEKEEM